MYQLIWVTFYNCTYNRVHCYLLCMALRQRAHFWVFYQDLGMPTKMSLRTPNPLYTRTTWRLQWDLLWKYDFNRLHCAWLSLQEQFSLKIVYVCSSSAFLLKFCTTSWTQYRLAVCDFVWCFFFFFFFFCSRPSSNCFAWLAEGQVSSKCGLVKPYPKMLTQIFFLYPDCYKYIIYV